MRFVLVSVALVGFLLAGPVMAQEQTDTDALIRDLNKLIDTAEKERKADPWFIKDLREALAKYERDWTTRILQDDFSGRGPGPDEPWKVTAGEFRIDWRYGLRSVVEGQPAKAAAPQQPKTQDDRREINVLDIFGAVLGTGKSGEVSSSGQPQQKSATAPSFAAMIAPVKISNGFSFQLRFTARDVPNGTQGGLELGFYQGENADPGYRLALRPWAAAGTPAVELIKRSNRGVATLDYSDQPLNIVDGREHVLLWTRSTDGVMRISLDGQELLLVTDRSFRDPFDGVLAINSGGDFAFRQVTIDGTR